MVWRRLGYLPQEFGFYPHLTGEAMLMHLLRLKGVTSPGAGTALRELLERVNLSFAAGRKVKTYSGGMRQRLGIAQAIAGNPRLIIVDEPTAGLDPEERLRFYHLLAELAEDRIVLLSTHIVEDVAVLCPRFAVIRDGRLVADTTPREARGRSGASSRAPSPPICRSCSPIPIVASPRRSWSRAGTASASTSRRATRRPDSRRCPRRLEDAYLVLIKGRSACRRNHLTRFVATASRSAAGRRGCPHEPAHPSSTSLSPGGSTPLLDRLRGAVRPHAPTSDVPGLGLDPRPDAWGMSTGLMRIESGDATVGGTKAWITSEFAVRCNWRS